MSGGLQKLLKEKRTDDLGLLYSLYKPVPDCLAPIGIQFRKHIIEEGQALVKSVEAQHKQGDKEITIKDVLDKSSYVESLLEMLTSLKNMVKKTFSNDSIFKSQMQNAFLVFVNEDIGKHNQA